MNPKAKCSTQFTARNHGPRRPRSALTAVVVHATGRFNKAYNTARYFAESSEAGSTQLIVGPDGCFRTLGDLVVPYGAPPLNSHGLHIEIEGADEESRHDWLVTHAGTLHEAAYHVAKWCHVYGIPPHVLDTAALLKAPRDGAGEPEPHGITYHRWVSDAFHQSTHQDPGPMDRHHFPYFTFHGMVLDYFHEWSA